jgi:hypothetical protein
VLSGRLKAVPVASLAAVILIGAIGPAATLASDPPGLARFMVAVGRAESGGNYQARNARSGAYGKYQIMPSSWRAWARRYLGRANAKPTPANQEIVAAAKFRELYRGLHSWRRVAHWWLTGSSRTTAWSASSTRYVNRVMTLYGKASKAQPAVPAGPAVRAAPIRRFSEKSATITYSGSWNSASHRGYTGDAVTYATRAGAAASFTFTGSKVVWYGPVGPTRGQARVLIDGAAVTTVNLQSRTFGAHKAVFSKRWSISGPHTLVIEVVGTAGHPFVAIDELAVSN